MRAKVWGCRGSLPTPGRETLRFGGNTSCVQVTLTDGTLLVLDAGTGIRTLGLELPSGGTVHVLLSHLHLDHVEGLAFFSPIWSPETELHVWGPPSPVRRLDERIARYLSPPLFPIQLSDVPSRLVFHDVPDEPWEIGSARLFAEAVSHPGPTLGYRVEENESSLAYIPDHEPALGVELRELSADWISGYGVAEGASALLHDAQYSESEYLDKVGWGHSSVADAVAFARISGAEQLVLFHHDPLHSDTDLAALQTRARELWGADGAQPELAYEGMEIVFSPEGADSTPRAKPLPT